MPRHIPVRSSRSTSKPEKSVTKGSSEALRIDKSEIVKILEELRKNANCLVLKADNDTIRNLNIVKDYANRLHRTDAYVGFYKTVLKIFNSTEAPVPGTVAAVCCGCNYTQGLDTDEKQCAATAIGSIPSPDMTAWPKSPYMTILITRKIDMSKDINQDVKKSKGVMDESATIIGDATVRDTLFCVSRVLQTGDTTQVMVYINGLGIEQITQEDLAVIKKLGIKNYNAYFYRSTGVYVKLENVPVDLLEEQAVANFDQKQHIKRVVKERKHYFSKHNGNKNAIFLVTIVAVLLFVLLVVMILLAKKRGRKL